MALVIPQDAYAEVDEVAARVLRQFPDSGLQSSEKIEDFLRDGKQRIDGAIRRLLPDGGITDEDEHKTAISILGPINADYAAERVFGSQRERFQSGNISTRWREDLQAVRRGELDLGFTEVAESFLGSFGGVTYRG